MSVSSLKVLIRGGGELASAVACRLAACHFRILMTETDHPEAIRRRVAFSEAVYEREKTVEGVSARLVRTTGEIDAAWKAGWLAIIVDPEARIRDQVTPEVVVDAIIAKRNLGTRITDAPLVIGLGIGFTAGLDVHAVVETNRGHDLGRVLRQGRAQPDTGRPGVIAGYSEERVLRAPADGILRTTGEIGDIVAAGAVIATVGDEPMRTAIPGVIRGLLRDGTTVHKGMKSGDVDPRGEPRNCDTISDKGRAIAGGVLEAIMARFNAPGE